MKPKITKKQFIERMRFGKSLEEWTQHWRVRRCNCAQAGCQGWRAYPIGDKAPAQFPFPVADVTPPIERTRKIRIVTRPIRAEFHYTIPGAQTLTVALVEDDIVTNDIKILATDAILADLDKYGIEYDEVIE